MKLMTVSNTDGSGDDNGGDRSSSDCSGKKDDLYLQ